MNDGQRMTERRNEANAQFEEGGPNLARLSDNLLSLC